jgi:predicted metal-dependent HD superfamily phosphohydrolase
MTYYNSANLANNLELLCTYAERYYKFFNRQYHSLSHATHVRKTAAYLYKAECKLLGLDIVSLDLASLEIAAMWHDAVYIPGAKGSANEEASAAALQHTSTVNFPHAFLSAEHTRVVSTAADWIRKTTIADHTSIYSPYRTLGLQCLLDADLSSFADTQMFTHNNHSIIHEFGLDINPTTIALQRKFLNDLADTREFIYHTETARKDFEALARANIRSY